MSDSSSLQDDFDFSLYAVEIPFDGDFSFLDGSGIDPSSVTDVVAYDNGSYLISVDDLSSSDFFDFFVPSDDVFSFDDVDYVSSDNFDDYGISPASVTVNNWTDITSYFNVPSFSFSRSKTVFVPWNNFGYSAYVTTSGSQFGKWALMNYFDDFEFRFNDISFAVGAPAGIPSYDYYIYGFVFKSVTNNMSYVNNANSNSHTSSFLNGIYIDVNLHGLSYRIPVDSVRHYIVLSEPVAYPVFTLTPVYDYGLWARGAYYLSGSGSPPSYGASFTLDASITLNNFYVYGFNRASSGDVMINSSITAMSSSLGSKLDLLHQMINNQITYVRSAIADFSNRQHEDMTTLDANNVKWLNNISNLIIQWSGTINTTLINYFTEINKNILAFYARNHTDLVQIHTDLTTYDGTAGGLDGANDDFKSEMDSYHDNTDTSQQYKNIDDSIFSLDTDFFTSLSSTATFFSALVTMTFNSLGDFSVALTMFLVMVFVSVVLGIVSHVRG